MVLNGISPEKMVLNGIKRYYTEQILLKGIVTEKMVLNGISQSKGIKWYCYRENDIKFY